MPGATGGAQRCGVCGKEYAKKTRLDEHMRSHTGERPFVCAYPGCNAAYMRSSHLAAHSRTHRDPSEKRFSCEQCDRSFWTAQHLHRHVLSCHTPGASCGAVAADLGDSAISGLYKCNVLECNKLFAKRKYLRQHIREVHAREDGRVYECTAPGCDRRFPSMSKLAQHGRTHDDQRYTCPLRHDKPPTDGARLLSHDPAGPWAFPTWTKLQHHMREMHPPQCPICSRIFASRDNLRQHARIHNERADGFECTWNGCGLAFSSRYALTTHIGRVHRGERPFQCETCDQSFGYRQVLDKHAAKCHQKCSPDGAGAASNEPYLPHVSLLVGQKRPLRRVLHCPWGSEIGDKDESCPLRYTRLYDLRRHLASAHALSLTDDELRVLLTPEEVDELARKKR